MVNVIPHMFRFCLLVALMFVYSGTSWAFLDVVKNLELVLVGDKFVEIEFDAVDQATGYTLVLGTQSVQGPEQSYNLPPIEMGVETRFRVENLQPDGEYFMRVFANSETETSTFLSSELYVNMKDLASAVTLPQVSNIDILNIRSIQVSFSEAMDFNFLTGKIGIRQLIDNSEIEIEDIEILNNTSVKLKFSKNQDRNAEYQLFIQPSLRSVNGESITDGEYVQNFTIEETAPDFFEAPDVVFEPLKATQFDGQSFEIELSKSVKYTDGIESNFDIFSASDPDTSITVNEVLINQLEDTKLLVVTDNFDVKDTFIIEISNLEALDGSVFPRENMQIEVSKPVTESPTPVVEPVKELVDVTDLEANLSNSNPGRVDLNFENPDLNSADKFQIFIKTQDGKDFNLLQELSKDLTKVALNIGSPKSSAVELKVVAVDQDGNSSKGVITRLLIPETGPATWFATLFGSSLLGLWLSRRRKQY